MITKIISGGQTGAGQGALDAAIKLDIPHGGWIPKGRKTEDGPLPARYHLTEMSSGSYTKRTEQNVLDSEGTLILSHGVLTGGSLHTRRVAKRHKRPWLHIDLCQYNAVKAAIVIKEWILDFEISVLNVAGSRASKDPRIYQVTKDIIESVYYLSLVKAPIEDIRKMVNIPRTVVEAVDRLVLEIPLKQKAIMAHMTGDDLDGLHFTLGSYIRDNFGLWSGNEKLMQSCRSLPGDDSLDVDSASFVIIKELWKRLRKTHKLRIVE